MEIKVFSKDSIVPSSTSIKNKLPYKFCLFNQLTPSTYSPVVFFYNSVGSPNDAQISKLKTSLAETLNLYYPLSGRVKDNLIVDGFFEGIPFLVARANGSLKDFLKHENVESLNRLLPYQPFTKEVDIACPMIAFQVTIFRCGGLVLGFSASHKLVDGPTAKAFLQTWGAISRGSLNEIVVPELEEPSKVFPSRESFPQSYMSLMESLWFTEDNYITKRFVFGPRAISMLKKKASGRAGGHVSKIEAVTCFIWRCCMDASMEASDGSSRPSVLVEAVNLRTRTTPPMSNSAIGDVFWWATVVANPTDSNTELHDLVGMLHEAICLYDGDYTQSLQGEEGFETMSEYFEQLEGLFSLEKPDIFGFTCWSHLGFTKLDFGWGEPFWVGVMGKVGRAFRNLTILVETKDGHGIEAWITLDAKRMAFLQKHPDLLAYASSNPVLSTL